MNVGSPRIAALALGVRAVERDGAFEAAALRLLRAREEAERERLADAGRRGREEGA